MDFIDFSVIDILDVLVVTILLYQIFRVVRGTGAIAIFAGIFVIYLAWIVVRMMGMELLSSLLGQIIGVGSLAIVIVFQQEIRRYLLMLGRRSSKGIWQKIFTSRQYEMDSHILDELIDACVSMSNTKTGALIVLERSTDIEVYMSSGDVINAQISKRLIENIFFKNSPLHDGAMIISAGRIAAARCILPTSDNPNIPAHLGLRHRAAVGLSENSDALVIVVSEETGKVSVIENGDIKTLVNAAQIRDVFKKNS